MGKTSRNSKPTPRASRLPKRRPKVQKPTGASGAPTLHVERDPNMTDEQYRRQLAVAAWLMKRSEEAASLTPEQAREEERQWQRFKQSINQHRNGYRKLYLE